MIGAEGGSDIGLKIGHAGGICENAEIVDVSMAGVAVAKNLFVRIDNCNERIEKGLLPKQQGCIARALASIVSCCVGVDSRRDVHDQGGGTMLRADLVEFRRKPLHLGLTSIRVG